MSVMAVLLLWLLVVAVGRGISRLLPDPDPRARGVAGRLLFWSLAGLFGLHVVLTTVDVLGGQWTPMLLAWLAAAALALNLLRHGRKPGAPAGPGGSLSWGLVVAGAAALVLAWAVASLWSTNPDFIYHWGIKGHRFFLAGGIDEAFLKKPWNRLSHPDYPFLQPELFAVTAVLRGFFDEPAMLLESALWCFLAAVAARQA
ncbi:MAG: hypothetical protein KDD47_26945, partial [Acidobacteria bacterium]|nr:hypothetical protein [Acidobacteriota bacterium]